MSKRDRIARLEAEVEELCQIVQHLTYVLGDLTPRDDGAAIRVQTIIDSNHQRVGQLRGRRQ